MFKKVDSLSRMGAWLARLVFVGLMILAMRTLKPFIGDIHPDITAVGIVLMVSGAIWLKFYPVIGGSAIAAGLICSLLAILTSKLRLNPSH
ncbi:MAG TPA: hypothetical protein V6D17_15830 [Candidatus Obscuribacterales bacterium]